MYLYKFVDKREKPYQCFECQKGFSCKRHLKKHWRKTNHIVGKDPIKCYMCDQCGNLFGGDDKLKTHMVVKHGIFDTNIDTGKLKYLLS